MKIFKGNSLSLLGLCVAAVCLTFVSISTRAQFPPPPVCSSSNCTYYDSSGNGSPGTCGAFLRECDCFGLFNNQKQAACISSGGGN